jgi:hypothetical protein
MLRIPAMDASRIVTPEGTCPQNGIPRRCASSASAKNADLGRAEVTTTNSAPSSAASRTARRASDSPSTGR